MAGVPRKRQLSGFTVLRNNIRALPGKAGAQRAREPRNNNTGRERYQHLLETLDLMENWTAYLSDE